MHTNNSSVLEITSPDLTEEEQTVIEDTSEPEEKAEPKPNKSKKKQKNRTSEELYEASIKSMSDKEKKKHIEDLRDHVKYLEGQNEMYQQNLNSAYQQVRDAQQALQDYKTKARGVVHFMKQSVTTCYNATLMATKMEEL